MGSDPKTEAGRGFEIPDLDAHLDAMLGDDGELITTGVAKARIRAWLRARNRATRFAATGELDAPRGDGDTDV